MSSSARSAALLGAALLSLVSLAATPGGFRWLAVAGFLLLTLLLVGLAMREERLASRALPSARYQRLLTWVVVLACLVHAFRHRLLYAASPTLGAVVHGGVAVVALLSLTQLFPTRVSTSLRRGTAAAALGLALLLVTAVPLVSPDPKIDVFVFQQEGAAALAAGTNPYTASYTNIYAHGTPWYPGGEPTAQPYPPMSFLFSLTSLLTGDVRFALAACHLLATLFLYMTGRALRLGVGESLLTAVLFLWLPGTLFQIEQAWTESGLVLGLSLFSFLLARARPAAAMLAVGLALALKQTMVVLAPFLLACWPRLRLQQLLWAALLPVAAYVPFLLWDARALFEDLVLFHAATPFRPGGNTLSSALHRLGAGPLPAAAGAVTLVLLLILFLPRLHRLAAREPLPARWMSFLYAAVASTYVAVLLCSKHAFFNYYYLAHFMVVSALCWSRGADLQEPEPTNTLPRTAVQYRV